MPILPIRLKAVAHIPHGSGDACYHLIDADADNSDVMAIVDPNMAMDDSAAFAERLALASNAHDALVAALQAALYTIRAQDEEYDALPSYVQGVRALHEAGAVS